MIIIVLTVVSLTYTLRLEGSRFVTVQHFAKAEYQLPFLYPIITKLPDVKYEIVKVRTIIETIPFLS